MKQKHLIAMAIAVLCFSFLLLSFKKKNGTRDSRPNILLIVSDDNGPHLSCYGDTVIQTTHLDEIARNGVLFTNAYVTESVCSPSRSSILTGLYPHQNGHLGLTTHGFHFVGNITTVYQQLKTAGYRTGMLGKLHLKPDSIFPIDYYPLKEPNYEKKNLSRYASYAGTFMNQSDEPFFLMVNLPDPHWPFENVKEGRPAHPVTADKVTSFPYIGFDNPRIRQYSTAIYNGILRLDECIGELMARLKASGKEKNTMVIYLSDHGDEMARGKFDIYEAATKVPFLVSYPGVSGKRLRSDALVSAVDIVPTLLDAAGVAAVPMGVTGKSLLPLLQKPKAHFREYLFTEKNCDEVDMYYPRRAIRDKRYKLIYSLLAHEKNSVAVRYTTSGPASPVAGSPNVKELETAPDAVKKIYHDWVNPARVQLYDLVNDPYEFYDLSSDPRYASVKKKLLNELFKWQKETDDPLRFPENVQKLTQENNAMQQSTNRQWKYPQYLYGK